MKTLALLVALAALLFRPEPALADEPQACIHSIDPNTADTQCVEGSLVDVLLFYVDTIFEARNTHQCLTDRCEPVPCSSDPAETCSRCEPADDDSICLF